MDARHQIKKRAPNHMNLIDYMGFKLTVLITRSVLESIGKEEKKKMHRSQSSWRWEGRNKSCTTLIQGIAEIGALRATKNHRKAVY
jgi:hypothetical protein